MLRFSLFGIPIIIHWMFWLVAVLFGTSLNSGVGPQEAQRLLGWVAAVFISILAHELGHALMFKRYGGRSSIMLYGMGGLTSAPGHFNRNQTILITAAGPAVGFALWFLIWWLLRTFRLSIIELAYPLRVFLSSMLWINLVWSLINLLPVIPLDGGKIFEAIVGRDRHRVVGLVGMVTAIICAIWSLRFGFIFLPILMGYLAYRNWQRSQGQNPQFF